MKPMRKLASITNFGFVELPIAGEEAVLTIEGMLSDPVWEVQKESIDVNIPQNKIVIRIWVTRDPSLMAAHVTKRFVKEIKITIPHSGTWNVQVNDKNLETDVQ